MENWEKDFLQQLKTPSESKPIGLVENIKRGGWGGFFDRATFGIKPTIEVVQLYNSAKRLQLRDYDKSEDGYRQWLEDRDRVANYLEEQAEIEERGLTIPAKVGNVAFDMLPFMVEFIATGGLASLGKAGARRGILKLAGKYAKTTTAKTAARIGGAMGSAAVRTAATPHHIVEGYYKRRLPDMQFNQDGKIEFTDPDEKPATAFLKAAGDHFIEMLSEVSGAGIGKVGKATAKAIIPKQVSNSLGKIYNGLKNAWVNAAPGRDAMQFAQKMATHAGFHGILEEMGEERLGDVLRATFNIEDFGAGKDSNVFQRLVKAIPGGEQLAVEGLAFSVPGVAKMGAAGVYELSKSKPARSEIEDDPSLEVDSEQKTSTPAAPVEPRTAPRPMEVSARPIDPVRTPPVAPPVKSGAGPVESRPPVVAETEQRQAPATPVEPSKPPEGVRETTLQIEPQAASESIGGTPVSEIQAMTHNQFQNWVRPRSGTGDAKGAVEAARGLRARGELDDFAIRNIRARLLDGLSSEDWSGIAKSIGVSETEAKEIAARNKERNDRIRAAVREIESMKEAQTQTPSRPVQSPPPVVAKTQDISPDVTPPTEIPPASTETPASQSAVAKEPWEMTREEYESQYPESPAPVEFNDSKVTESVYHGSNQNNISEFFTDAKQLGGSTKARTAKLGAFFSESPDIASMASFGFSEFGIFSENELSLYKARINLRNPLDINNMSDAELAALEQKFPGITKIAKEADDPFEVVQFIARSRRPVPYPKNPNFATYAKSKGLSEEQIKSAWKNSENPVYAEWLARENANIDAISNPVDGQEKLKDLGYDGIIVKTMMDSSEEIGPKKQYIVFNKSDVHIERRTPVAGHKIAVQVAKSQGKSIPSHVQAQYPDLFPVAGKKVDTPAPAQTGGKEQTPANLKISPAKTPGAKTRLGVAGMREGFEIITPDGARIAGYVVNADFPGDKTSRTRGELFYVEVPESQRRQGVGLSLAKDALRLLKENGATTVNMSPTSEAGKALVERLIKEGDIGETPIRTAQSGKTEYEITLGRKRSQFAAAQTPAKQSPVEAAAPVVATPDIAAGIDLIRKQPEFKDVTDAEARALLEDPDPEATVRDILKRRGVDVDRVDIPRYDIRLAITEDAAAEENRPTIKGMKPSHQEAINLAVDEAMRIVTDIRDTLWPEMKKRLAEIKSNLGKATISSQTEQSTAETSFTPGPTSEPKEQLESQQQTAAIGKPVLAAVNEIDREEIKVSLEPQGGKPMTAGEIIRQLERDFKIPIRGKATHVKKNVLGWFSAHAVGIRMKDVREITTATHEIGHHIDWTLNNRLSKNPPTKEIAAELTDLGKALYGSKQPAGGYKSEGWAEFMRMYLTGEDTKEAAPNLHQWFTQNYLPNNTDIARKVARAKQMITNWRLQGADSMVDGFMSGKVKTTIGEMLERLSFSFHKNWRDKFHVLKKLRDKAGQLRPSEDPFELATAFSQKAPAKARQFVLEKTTDLAGNVTGKGLREILAPIQNMREFARYAVTKRARLLNDRGFKSGLSDVVIDYIINKYKSDEYDQVLKDLTAWNHRVIDYLVEAGGMENAVASNIKAMNPVYVPFLRTFAEDEIIAKGGGFGKGFKPGKAVHRIKGSGREIKDIFESMILNTQRTIEIAHKSAVSRSIAKLADRPAMAGWIWKVPAPKQATSFSAEQLKEDIARLAVTKLGLDPHEINIDGYMEHWDDILTIYTHAHQYYGKDNIVSVVVDGKRQWFEVHPELYKAMEGIDQNSNDIIWKMLYYGPGFISRGVRLGATGLNPSFGLIRNFIRDAMTFSILRKHSKRGALGAAKGVIDDVRNTEAAKRFAALGGKMSGYIGQDRRGLKAIKSQLFASNGKKYALHTVLHPVDALRELFGITEAGVRIAEFEAAYKDAAAKYGEGTLDAAIYALNQAQDVTTNFTRHGVYAKYLNQLIPFFNAAIQGPDKIIRTFKERPIEAAIRSVAYLTIPAIGLWWKYKDEDWYENLPDYEKVNYLHFRVPGTEDTIVRLPVPFELGHIFQSMPVAALDAAYNERPEDFTGSLVNILDQANPFGSRWLIGGIPAVGIAVQLIANKDWAGRPIVPMSAQGRLPADQYGPYTTELMKHIGKALNVSPAKLEYAVDSLSGGLYRRTIRGAEVIAGQRDYETGLSDMPVLGTLFTRDPYAPQAQIERFYKRRDALNRKYQSKAITKPETRERAAYNKIGDMLSLYWKKLHNAKTIEERKEIYGKIGKLVEKAEGFTARTNSQKEQ